MTHTIIDQLQASGSLRPSPGSIALFCGAGISKSSSLPLAGELQRCILDHLPFDPSGIAGDGSLPIPFEAFMEDLADNVDIRSLVEMFTCSRPNENHWAVAQLAKAGLASLVVTTNFDLLFERAFNAVGLEEGRHFQRLANEEQLHTVASAVEDCGTALVKIHGSAEDFDSVRTTLRTIAANSLSAARMTVVKYTFSTGRHDLVLVLGYSCSDRFDINPQVQSIETERKRVVLILHSPGRDTFGPLSVLPAENPFRRYPGWAAQCDTGEFLTELSRRLDLSLAPKDHAEGALNWRAFVDDWAANISKIPGMAHRLAGRIFYRLSDFHCALASYRQELDEVKSAGAQDRLAVCYVNLGLVYQRMSKYDDSITCLHKALDAAKRGATSKEWMLCYVNLGDTHLSRGDFSEAANWLRRGLRLAEQREDPLGVAECHRSLASALRNLRQFTEALRHLELALKVSESIGDLSGVSACYTNMGTTYHGLGQLKRAKAYHSKSLEVDCTIGDRSDEALSLGNLGLVCSDMGEYADAERYLRRAAQIAQELGLLPVEGMSRGGLGIIFDELGRYSESVEQLRLAADIFEQTGQEHYRRAALRNLAEVSAKLKR